MYNKGFSFHIHLYLLSYPDVFRLLCLPRDDTGSGEDVRDSRFLKDGRGLIKMAPERHFE